MPTPKIKRPRLVRTVLLRQSIDDSKAVIAGLDRPGLRGSRTIAGEIGAVMRNQLSPLGYGRIRFLDQPPVYNRHGLFVAIGDYEGFAFMRPGTGASWRVSACTPFRKALGLTLGKVRYFVVEAA